MSGYVISKISGLFDGINGAFKGFLLPNGKEFLSAYPYILAQSGTPVGIAPNGTVAANGVITLGTALPRTYSAGIWLYLPAGAVSGGAAGLYWCVMSSTTVGQVYTNSVDTSQGFVPYVPTGVLVNAVGSNSAYTQTINTSIALANLTLPAGSLGPNGQIRMNWEFSYNIAAGNKTFSSLINGSQLASSLRSTTGGHDSYTLRLRNLGVQNSNSVYAISESGTSSVTPQSIISVDTSVSQVIAIYINIDTATNYGVIDSFSFEVLPS
jgi:hypothetical protein